MKRAISALLAALVLVGLLSAGAVTAAAASDLKTSDLAVEVLKRTEGFSATAYYDNGQYSIGYGTAVDPEDYPLGVTKAEAEKLMREHLAVDEAEINKFIRARGLNLSQAQFDALMLFTYNCGSGWTRSDGVFRSAVINGKTGNEFIYALSLWCKSGGGVSVGHINRRLAEADLYLTGSYAVKPPSSYTYVLFDINGGDSINGEAQGYDAAKPTIVMGTPIRTGYRFLGWYTAKEGGKWVSDLDSTTAKATLYAHWQKDEGELDDEGKILGSQVSYERIVAGDSLAVYAIPVSAGTPKKTLKENDKVSIVADYVDADGIKWGKLSTGGWIDMTETTVTLTPAKETVRYEVEYVPPEDGEVEEDPYIEVRVTATSLNIRKQPGNGKVVNSASRGETLKITEVELVDGTPWGKIAAGWVCLDYTSYESVMENTDMVTATGIVKTNLRIRQEPSTASKQMGMLSAGDKVSITAQRTVKGVKWGKISQGWICLDYVTLTPVAPDLDGGDDTTDKPTEPEEPDVPDPTDPPEEDDKDTPDTSDKKANGTVISKSNLNVRQGPGTNYKVVGSYASGARVVILDQKMVDTTPWGKTEKGWVSMNFVRLDSGSTIPTGQVTGIVKCDSFLNIRKTPGASGERIGAYANGDRVLVLSQKLVGNVAWGQTDKGWICMDYVTVVADVPDSGDQGGNTGSGETDTPEQKPEDTPVTGSVIATGKVVNANSLRIRGGAGTNTPTVGTLTMGAKVEIYEMQMVQGVIWGRISNGWISMNYVELDATAGNVVLLRCTTTSNLNIRVGAGAQYKVVNSYSRGSSVEIYAFSKVGDDLWGRTDKGWISLEYVK